MQSYSCLILHFISLQMQKKTCTPSLVSIELKTKLWSGLANNSCYCHESNPFMWPLHATKSIHVDVELAK